MKKFLAVVVVLGLCGLYWYGCQKKEAPTTTEPEAAMTQPAPEAATPTPTPPPAPAAEEATPPATEETASE